ncbi:MAG TPA: isoprenylcysteine carboxylmethyltransferase family protein [Gemmatimonadaceae bacterium]|nr:isoprenylcysteine carboxylmethyltransferase family protein [Gemmatimonadaceae bacterium]
MSNTTDPTDRSGVRIFPPAIFLLGVAAGVLVARLWPAHLAPSSAVPAVRLMGWLLVGLWLFLNVWAVLTFRWQKTSPNPWRATSSLALRGPYMYTRNPMYLSLVLLQAGIALVTNNLWVLLMLFPEVVVVQRAVIAREEAYLERKFGAEYTGYKARVRRWI